MDSTWQGCRAQNQDDSSYKEINKDTHAGGNHNGSSQGDCGLPTGQGERLTNCFAACLYTAPFVY